MVKFQNKYRIPSTRLQHWDYGQPAAYFVTICTKGRENHFGDVINGKMNLSGVGIIADILWHEIKNHTPNIELGEFVVMPNHVHGIIIIHNSDNNIGNGDIVETLHATSLRPPIHRNPHQPESKNEFMANISPKSKSLPTIIRSYKSAVSKHAHRLGFNFAWQSRFHDHIIRNEQSYQTISEYIMNNPLKWNEDKFNPTNKTAKE